MSGGMQEGALGIGAVGTLKVVGALRIVGIGGTYVNTLLDIAAMLKDMRTNFKNSLTQPQQSGWTCRQSRITHGGPKSHLLPTYISSQYCTRV